MSLSLLEHGAQRLDELVKPGMLCAFDFDGTLAPIVKDPDRASIPVAVLRRLIVLSELTKVAVISSRPVEDLGLRLDFLPEFVIGNDGLESVPEWEDAAQQYRALCLQWEQQLAGCAGIAAGVLVENKGCFLTVYDHMTRQRDAVETGLMHLFAKLDPAPRVVAGKHAFSLLPSSAPDKSAVLAHLCEASGTSSAIYVSDDASDEDVFKLRRSDWLSVRIDGSGGSMAEFHLHHRLDMVQLLDMLIQRLQEVRSPAGESGAALHAQRVARP